MKKVLLKSVILLMASICWLTNNPTVVSATTNKNTNRNDKGPLLTVVIYDEQTKLSQTLMAAIEKYWTCSKYEFINLKEFETRCMSNGFFLVVLGASDDKYSMNFHAISILKMDGWVSLSGDMYHAAIDVKTDKKTHEIDVIFSADAEKISIQNNNVTTGPEFFIAMLNDIFEQKFIKKNKKRCFNGTRSTPEGMLYFDNVSNDIMNGKTLLIDQPTADKMLKQFENENQLKEIISKTTGIPENKIFILSTEEFCKSFNAEKEDILYMYTYYSRYELNLSNNIGELWMAPNILDYKGRLIASLMNYKKLIKIHGKK